MFSTRFICFPVFFALLSGCATYESKEVDSGQIQLQLERRTLSDSGLVKFLAQHGEAVAGEWDLEKLTLAAIYYNPGLDVVRADYAAAKAGVIGAAAFPNPAFNFSPGYNVDSGSGVSPWILGYVLEVPLDLTGQRKQRSAQAGYQEEIARLNLASAAWAVRSEVRQALVDLHAAEETAAFWKGQITLLSEVLKLVENEVQVGELSSFEAGQTRIVVSRAEIDARESVRARISARIRLAEALGVSAPALADLAISYRGLDVASPKISRAEASAWAAQNRPDLLATLSAYAVAQSVLQSEIARQYPDLILGPGYELDQGEGKWSFSFGLTLPVFNRNQGPIAVAEAQRESAAAKVLALQNHVLSQLDQALANYSSAVQDLETFNSMHASIDQQTKTLQAQQAIGEVSRLELARAQIELADHLSAELAVVQRVEQSLAALEDAVQRPLAWQDSVWSSSPRNANTP